MKKHKDKRKNQNLTKCPNKVGRKTKKNMATLKACFEFENDNYYSDAKNAFYNQMSGDYGNSDKLYFYESYRRIYIYSECSNSIRATEICREHGGKFVANP